MIDRPTFLAVAPRIVAPDGWRFGYAAEDGDSWINPGARQTAIVSVAREGDGRLWLHASLAGRDRLPTWEQLARFKEWAIGPERVAYQVYAPASRHVNIHPFALHLWTPLEGDPPLPDFTAGGQSI